MPTPNTNVRLDSDLIAAARRVLGLPADAPVSRVIRAGLQRLTGQDDTTGQPASRGGRPKRQPVEAGQ